MNCERDVKGRALGGDGRLVVCEENREGILG